MNIQKILTWAPLVLKSIQIPLIIESILSASIALRTDQFTVSSIVFFIIFLIVALADYLLAHFILKKYPQIYSLSASGLLAKRKSMMIQIILIILLVVNFILVQSNIFKGMAIQSVLYTNNVCLFAIIGVRGLIGLVAEIKGTRNKQASNELNEQRGDGFGQPLENYSKFSRENGLQNKIVINVPAMGESTSRQYQHFEDELVEI